MALYALNASHSRSYDKASYISNMYLYTRNELTRACTRKSSFENQPIHIFLYFDILQVTEHKHQKIIIEIQ